MATKRILVVDDHQDNLDCVVAILQGSFEVETACGGEAALRTLEREHFDALMLDLTMPDVDGFDVMSFVNDRLPDLPVMLASALPDVERIAAELGAKDWITKPYRPALLPQKLKLLVSHGEGREDAQG